MTQEEKNLLLKDLCARLPYGVKVLNKEEIITIKAYIPDLVIDEFGISHMVEDCKPYLFPLSNMSKEQLNELKDITDFKYHSNTVKLSKWTETTMMLEFFLEEVPQTEVIEVFDFLNENHFDYRYLIEQGLAIDATDKNIY